MDRDAETDISEETITADNFIERNKNIEISISKKIEKIEEIVKEIKEIVESKFADEHDIYILNDFLKEPEKYASNFEEALQDRLENDNDFRIILE
jgi:hypothetical protein